MKRVREERVKGLYGRKKKVFISVTCLLGILCAIIIIITFYGQNVGTFSVKLGDDLKNRSIFVSTDPEFNWYNSRLEADSLENASTFSMMFIKQNECKKTNGSYIGTNRGYIGYTFYLKNLGTETVNVSQICRISGYNEDKNMADVSWFWYFEDDEKDGVVYQKPDENVEEGYWDDLPDQYRNTTAFEDDDIVYTREIKDLNPGDVKKITLITWVEANDPDLDDRLKNQTIRYELSFAVFGEE